MRGIIEGDYIYYDVDGHRIFAKIEPSPEDKININASLSLGRFIFGEIIVKPLEDKD